MRLRRLSFSGSRRTLTDFSRPTKKLGFSEMIDLSAEGLAEGVCRLTDGYGADIVVDGIGGDIQSDALGVLAPGGGLTTLGYVASRNTTIDVTNLIWKGASIKSFSLFAQPDAPPEDAVFQWLVTVSGRCSSDRQFCGRWRPARTQVMFHTESGKERQDHRNSTVKILSR
jgi:NADPH:quinone reductase-like Zn-dependent oxidoreductase